MKRSQPKRDWTLARAKCDREGCRICGEPAQAAHIIGRHLDKGSNYVVRAERIVPLCRDHHRAYDAHTLDLLPHLTKEEASQAVYDVGFEPARRRISGQRVAA